MSKKTYDRPVAADEPYDCGRLVREHLQRERRLGIAVAPAARRGAAACPALRRLVRGDDGPGRAKGE